MNKLILNEKIKEGFENLKPSSLIGEQFIQKYKDFNPESCVQIYQMLSEGSIINDKDISTWSKSTQAKIQSNIPYSFNLGYALEESRNSKSFMNEDTNDKLNYLQYYKEADLVESIKNGVLESFVDFSPRIKWMHESLSKIPENKKILSNTHIAFNPISYVFESKGCQYFQVEGKVFRFDNEKISEDVSPNIEFSNVNNAVERIPFDTTNDLYSVSMLPGTVNVTKNGKVTINGEEVNSDEFKGVMSSVISECLDQNLKENNAILGDCIITLKENFDKISILDMVDTCKNLHTNESLSLMRHPRGYYLYEKLNNSTKFIKFLSLNEAIKHIKDFTGINLMSKYQNICLKEMRDIQSVKTLVEEYKTQKAKISETLELAKKDLSILNSDSDERIELEKEIEELKEAEKEVDIMIEQYSMILSSVNAN